jgi:hypothetical protein
MVAEHVAAVRKAAQAAVERAFTGPITNQDCSQAAMTALIRNSARECLGVRRVSSACDRAYLDGNSLTPG